MKNTLITLAEIHYKIGLIGLDEYQERIHIALWLADEHDGMDPRLNSQEKAFDDYSGSLHEEDYDTLLDKNIESDSANEDINCWVEYLCLNTWVFTKSDPDSYPSVPHGHLKSQNNPWPKLNPYTGRVFSSKHQEDRRKRLSKKQMKTIWSDEQFKSFCREMIIYYQEQFPYHEFPVQNPFKFPRW